MNVETAQGILAEGASKYQGFAQIVDDMQFDMLRSLTASGILSEVAFKRMVAAPSGASPPPGSRGGPWIGARTLVDDEIIDPGSVAQVVVNEAMTVPGTPGSAVMFSPFLAPSVIGVLRGMRADHFANLGWFGQLIRGTPISRKFQPRSYDLLSTLDELLTPLHDEAPRTQERPAPASLGSLEQEFASRIQSLKTADSQTTTNAAMALHWLWHDFREKFPERKFEAASEQVKLDYIAEIDEFVGRATNDEQSGSAPCGTSYGARLFAIFLRAIARGDRELVNSMIDELDPLNRAAYELIQVSRLNDRSDQQRLAGLIHAKHSEK